MAPSSEISHHLVLVGGGHSHVEVLRDWARQPPSGAHLTMVSDGARAVYTGMVPGFVAGQYRRDEIEIDVERLARRASARWIDGRVTDVDLTERMLTVEGAPALRYTTVSFDVGATVAGLDLTGVRHYALPTRPIGEFARRAEALIDGAVREPSLKVAVVGAGPGGVELAFAFRARFDRLRMGGASVVLLERGRRLLAAYPERAAQRIRELAARRGIEIRCQGVTEANADGLVLEGGEILACAAFVWAAGAASLPFFDGSGIAQDDRGFVKVRPTLQAVGHDEIFATGDCVSLITEPHLPKAGVYAVRQGPVLAHNLKARVAGKPMRSFTPQRRYLSLLNLADGRALAVKGDFAADGAWAWWLKDSIDRAFIRRYR